MPAKRSNGRRRLPYMQPTQDQRFLTPAGELAGYEQCHAVIPGDKVALSTFHRRLKRFRYEKRRLPTLDEVLELARRPLRPAPRRVTVAGTSYPSVNAAACAHGISQAVLWRRICREGLSPDEAVAMGTRHRQGQHVTVDGRTFSSIAAAARAYRINRETLRRRLNVAGIPADAAVRPRVSRRGLGARD